MKKGVIVVVIIVLAFGMYYYLAFQQLDIDLDHVFINDVGMTSAAMTASLRVSNPNPLPMYITSTKFDLYLDNHYVGQGTSPSATISGNGYRTIPAPIIIAYTGLSIGVVNTLLSWGSITIDIRGEATFLLVNIPFQRSSTITIP